MQRVTGAHIITPAEYAIARMSRGGAPTPSREVGPVGRQINEALRACLAETPRARDLLVRFASREDVDDAHDMLAAAGWAAGWGNAEPLALEVHLPPLDDEAVDRVLVHLADGSVVVAEPRLLGDEGPRAVEYAVEGGDGRVVPHADAVRVVKTHRSAAEVAHQRALADAVTGSLRAAGLRDEAGRVTESLVALLGRLGCGVDEAARRVGALLGDEAALMDLAAEAFGRLYRGAGDNPRRRDYEAAVWAATHRAGAVRAERAAKAAGGSS